MDLAVAFLGMNDELVDEFFFQALSAAQGRGGFGAGFGGVRNPLYADPADFYTL